MAKKKPMQKILLSNNALSRQISTISNEQHEQLILRIKDGSKISIHLDESTRFCIQLDVSPVWKIYWFMSSMGHSMTNHHKRLTTTSLILIKIGVCGYLIAKTHWCKYCIFTTNMF